MRAYYMTGCLGAFRLMCKKFPSLSCNVFFYFLFLFSINFTFSRNYKIFHSVVDEDSGSAGNEMESSMHSKYTLLKRLLSL